MRQGKVYKKMGFSLCSYMPYINNRKEFYTNNVVHLNSLSQHLLSKQMVNRALKMVSIPMRFRSQNTPVQYTRPNLFIVTNNSYPSIIS